MIGLGVGSGMGVADGGADGGAFAFVDGVAEETDAGLCGGELLEDL